MGSHPVENTRHGNCHSRRSFISHAGGAFAAGTLGTLLAEGVATSKSAAAESENASETGQTPLIWGNLLHLSFNMWSDRPFDWGPHTVTSEELCYQPYLRCDDKLWEELTQRMADAGMNMLVIDLGDGVHYESHPEIAVQNAWSVERLQTELVRLRKLGLEPIPKLNFSTCHDAWLGPYARQVSTPIYYKVCEGLIDEVIQLFDKPRLFHIGFDEETAKNQRGYAYVAMRQHELWWHDFQFFVAQLERRGVRPWMWSDYAWKHNEEFLKKMPKSVLQSNWCYGLDFKDTNHAARLYSQLDQHGYDQILTGSNWSSPKNFGLLVEHCRKKIAPDRLNGFLQTSWMPTLEKFRQRHIEAIDLVATAVKTYAIQNR